MVNGHEDINRYWAKVFRNRSWGINFFVYFPFYLFLNETDIHLYAWICIFRHRGPPTSPFVPLICIVVYVAIIKVECKRVAWNEAFLKLLCLSRYTNNNAVVNWLDDFERYLALWGRQFLHCPDSMPGVIWARFQEGINIHLKGSFVMRKPAKMNDCPFSRIRLIFYIS